MMTWGEMILLVVYGAMLLFILAYSIVQGTLIYAYVKSGKRKRTHPDSPTQWPSVTVQLPVYNERYVVERLIHAVAAFDYPKNKLEIQILDDSTDDTTRIIEQTIMPYVNNGINICHIRREERTGFKAGALAYGTTIASGEFIAIFDADFVPATNFLKQTIPYFSNEQVGMVQSRWEHINKKYSLLTRLQAFGLNAHFTIEQTGRNAGSHFINFNGTGGIWRKSCILDSGGWSSDTLTEDLDLSYRAQFRGWKFIYLEDVTSPAELPATMDALKSQQFRWTKGAAETARLNVKKVLSASQLERSTRINALFHLMNSFLFVCILGTAILSIPLLYIKNQHETPPFVYNLAGVFAISLCILAAYYFISFKKTDTRSWWNFPSQFILFLSISMGMSLHNSIAVLEGLVGRKSPFIRTPKFNLNASDKTITANRYVATRVSPVTVAELILSVYFMSGIFIGFRVSDLGLLPYHVMLAFGFASVGTYTVWHAVKARRGGSR
ncbi:MAG: glycosyltransferase family 2 protein [Flavobacteriales bacterium]|nr:glycosyltransferase family 2 protein [Flavobacteriales bacterium]